MKKITVLAIAVLLVTSLAPRITGQTNFPEPPRVYLQSELPPSPGQQFVVSPAGLQAALNLAVPGDLILVTPGRVIAHLELKNTPDTPGWITVRPTSTWLLPPFGSRVSPSDVPNMVTVESPDTGPALDFYPTYAPAGVTKAHNYVFIGFNFAPSRNYPTNGGLVKTGTTSWQTSVSQCPSDIWIDRCVVSGYPDRELIRGVVLNGARVSITGCYIAECHSISSDAQAVCGWNGPGPYNIVNNYLEASGENFMLGGADPRIRGLVPADVVFRGNYCAKPLAWNWGLSSYAGRRWGVKNLFELKNARRVLVYGNVFENCWVDQEHGQVGFAVQITPRNQDGTAPWCTVEDVALLNNTIRHCAGGINFLGTDTEHPSGVLSRILVSGTLLEDIGTSDWGPNGRLFQVLDGVVDLSITHNTGLATHSFLNLSGRPMTRFSYTDNTVSRGQYGLNGDDSSEGSVAFRRYAPGGVFARNTVLTDSDVSALYPPGNYFARP